MEGRCAKLSRNTFENLLDVFVKDGPEFQLFSLLLRNFRSCYPKVKLLELHGVKKRRTFAYSWSCFCMWVDIVIIQNVFHWVRKLFGMEDKTLISIGGTRLDIVPCFELWNKEKEGEDKILINPVQEQKLFLKFTYSGRTMSNVNILRWIDEEKVETSVDNGKIHIFSIFCIIISEMSKVQWVCHFSTKLYIGLQLTVSLDDSICSDPDHKFLQ